MVEEKQTEEEGKGLPEVTTVRLGPCLENTLNKISKNAEKAAHNSRIAADDDTGCLGMMLLPILVASIGIVGYSCENQKKIDYILRNMPTAHVANVIRGPEPEKFYRINGQNVYLEIDGRPVQNILIGEIERRQERK